MNLLLVLVLLRVLALIVVLLLAELVRKAKLTNTVTVRDIGLSSRHLTLGFEQVVLEAL
jgi:hypothetical protein